MKTPFNMASDQFIMQMGHNTVGNSIAFDSAKGLAIKPAIWLVPFLNNLVTLAAAPNGPAIQANKPWDNLLQKMGFHPLMPFSVWLVDMTD